MSELKSANFVGMLHNSQNHVVILFLLNHLYSNLQMSKVMTESSFNTETSSSARVIQKDVNNENQISNSVESSMTKITDMNVDCLEMVFEHLDLPDLLNVADSNKELRSAAGIVFNRKYGKSLLHLNIKTLIQYNGTSIDMFRINVRSSFKYDYLLKKYPIISTKKLINSKPNTPKIYNPIMKIENGKISITDLYTSLRVVRCFGNWISRMHIDHLEYFESSRPCIELFRYANEYSADSLIELRVTDNHNIIVEFPKPFAKVETVSFEYVGMDIDQNIFKTWFPQMRHLELWEVKKIIFGVHFPNLESFDFRMTGYSQDVSEEQQLEVFVRENPHIKSITIREYLDGRFNRYMSVHLQKLEELRFIAVGPETTISNNYSDVGQVQFKTVKKFHMSDGGYDVFPVFAPSFDQLEEFTADGIPFDEIQNFVEKHPKIISLTIKKYVNHFNEEDVLQIVKALPLIGHLDVSVAGEYGFSIGSAIRFMTEFKQLSKLKIKLKLNEDNKLHKLMDKGWHVVAIDDHEYTSCIATFERSIY